MTKHDTERCPRCEAKVADCRNPWHTSPSPVPAEPTRCAICGWTLAESAAKGCVRGNCSLRPFPEKFYDFDRAEREYGRNFDISKRAETPPRLQEISRRFHAGHMTVEGALHWMADNGSSVCLSWGEDTCLWECSWIVGGERFTGNQSELHLAILDSLNLCFYESCCEAGRIYSMSRESKGTAETTPSAEREKIYKEALMKLSKGNRSPAVLGIAREALREAERVLGEK